MRAKTTEDRRLLEAIEPIAEGLGLDVVRVRLMGALKPGGARRLQIMAERPDGDITVNQCARLSRAVSAWLEESDPISGEYVLEVSSPGIDRPLTRIKDFQTYQGLEARLELDRMAEGRKRFKGRLAGVEDTADGPHIGIDLEGEADTALIPFAWITEAKLVLNDELMKLGAETRAARGPDEDPDEDEDLQDTVSEDEDT